MTKSWQADGQTDGRWVAPHQINSNDYISSKAEMGSCFLLMTDGEHESPSSWVPYRLQIDYSAPLCPYSYSWGTKSAANLWNCMIWWTIGCMLILNSYVGLVSAAITHRNSMRSHIGHSLALSLSESITIRSGVGLKFITAITPWLGVLVHKFHTEILTNDVRMTQSRKSFALCSQATLIAWPILYFYSHVTISVNAILGFDGKRFTTAHESQELQNFTTRWSVLNSSRVIVYLD